MDKPCRTCNKILDSSDFAIRSNGKLRPHCKECFKDKRRIRAKQKYPKDRVRILNKQQYLYRIFFCNLFEYLKTHPCIDCGESDPLKLEFDHTSIKQYNISQMRKISWDRALKEIAKCEVRCGSCHNKVTHIRQNSIRYRMARELNLINY